MGPSSRTVPARLAQTSLITIAVATTTVLYRSFFDSYAYLPRVLAVVVIGAVLATAVSRWSAAVAVVCAVAGFAVTALYAVLPSTLDHGVPGANTARVGWHAVTGGWAAMLSVAAPADDSPPMLMTPALVAWTAAFLAVTIALRTNSTLGPAAVVVAAQVFGLLVASNQQVTHLIQSGVVTVLLVVITLGRAGGARTGRQLAPDRSPRAVVTLTAVITAVGLAGGYAVVPIVADSRYNPRDALTDPLHLEQSADPLSQVRSQRRLPAARALFAITVSGASAPTDLVQIVSLDAFDGAEWSSTDSFRVAGPVLAPDPDLAAPAKTITEKVRLIAAAGPYVPEMGRPVRVDADLAPDAHLGFDPASGTLVLSGALTDPGYTVVAQARPADSGLAAAQTGEATNLARYLAMPAEAGDLMPRAARITSGAATPYAKAMAIQNYLRTLPCNIDAPAGDSYGSILRLLTAESPQGRAGYADQHAAAFAVLARLERLPTRIAVGYRLPGGGQDVVTTSDAYAWDQVYFQSYGWVDFDPTDLANTVSLPPVVPVPVQPVTPPAGPVSAPPGHPTATPSTPPPNGPSPSQTDFWRAHPTPAAGRVSLLIVLAAVLGVVLAAWMGLALAHRRLRRGRRRSGSPRMQVVGAWDESVDHLLGAGARISPAHTARELATHAAAAGRRAAEGAGERADRALVLAAPFLGELAAEATRAAFSRGPVTSDEAQRAWDLEHAIHEALNRGPRAPSRFRFRLPRTPRRRSPRRRR